MTWNVVRSACEAELGKAGIECPGRVVLDWFDDVFGIASRKGDELVPKANMVSINEQLERLILGEPLAYVTGIGHFYGYELEVVLLQKQISVSMKLVTYSKSFKEIFYQGRFSRKPNSSTSW